MEALRKHHAQAASEPRSKSKPQLDEVGPRAVPSRFRQDFERLELLGRGAFGEVWRCRHLLDGREYAVKAVKYRTNAADNGPLRHRVLREVQTWARLSHPNIVRYHNSWVEVEPASPGGFVTARSSNPSPRATSTRTAPAFWANGGSPRSCPEDGSHSGITFGDLSGDAQQWQATAATSPTAVGRTSRATFGVGLASPSPAYVATLYIQTELCSKGTVQAWIEKRNLAFASSSTTPEEKRQLNTEAGNIFGQVAQAVAEVHKLGCAHRDVKPSNLLFDRTGRVQLGDFGLAKEMGHVSPLESDGLGITKEPRDLVAPSSSQTLGVGTPAYASPQQLAEGRYGVETDIFSLGVVLAELLHPVQTQMERARLVEGLRHGRCLPSSVTAAFPTAANLVLAMTDPEPAARPTASDLMDAMPELSVEMQQPIGGDRAPAQMPQAHEQAKPEGLQQVGPAPWAPEGEGDEAFELELAPRPRDTRKRGRAPEGRSGADEPSADAVEEAKAAAEVEMEAVSSEPWSSAGCCKMQEPRASPPPAGAAPPPADCGACECDAMAPACRKFVILLVLFGLDRLRGLSIDPGIDEETPLKLLTPSCLGIGRWMDPGLGQGGAVDVDPLLYGSQLLRLLALICAAAALANNVCPLRKCQPAAEEEPGHVCARLQGALRGLLP